MMPFSVTPHGCMSNERGCGLRPAMVGGLRLVAVAVLLVLAGCGTLQPPASRPYALYHVVQSGDTLYSIAWRYGYDYHEIAAWNHIRPPYRIYAGEHISLIPSAMHTGGAGRSPAATSQNVVAADKGYGTAVVAPSHTRTASVEKPAWRPHHVHIVWRWPTKGVIKRGFGDSGSKKGVDIGGRFGQPVYAAAAGDVVYSGNGLVGYGNLVIIKHDDEFLSAYGDNRQLLVKEGEHVAAGQMIAEMGQTSKDGAVLHFEIRREGKPVDPLLYLPRTRN